MTRPFEGFLSETILCRLMFFLLLLLMVVSHSEWQAAVDILWLQLFIFFNLLLWVEVAGSESHCPRHQSLGWISRQIHSPWLGDKVDSSIGLSYSLPAYVAWRVGTTTRCGVSTLCPPVRDYEFSYSAVRIGSQLIHALPVSRLYQG